METLKMLYKDEKIILPASTSGNKITYQFEDVFSSWVDEGFKNLVLDKKGVDTLETEIKIYRVAKNITLKKMFTSLSDNLDSLCLTHNQIIDFCKKYPEYLKKAFYFLFLTKKDFNGPATKNNLLVVVVHLSSDGLRAGVFPFNFNLIFSKSYLHFVVVPVL